MDKKIFEELKTKYKNLGLSEGILKVFADKIAKTVKEENEVEDAVNAVEGELKIFQSFADQNRTLQREIMELKKEKEGEQVPTPTPTPAPETTEAKGEEIPAWAKAIIESNKALTENLQQLQAEKAQQTTAEKLTSKLKELGVSEYFYQPHIAGKTFENEEEIHAFAQKLKDSQEAYNQSLVNTVLKTQSEPIFGEADKEDGVSLDVQNYVNAKKQTYEQH